METMNEVLPELLGEEKYALWQAFCAAVEEKYAMDRLWGKGYKQWLWEYKYCRGGKTLCTLYAKENSFGLQIIFGRDERTKAEAVLDTLSPKIREAYENAYTWHDGKWVMFLPENVSEFPDYLRLLALKRRPNRK